MVKKEVVLQIIKDMKTHLNKDADFSTFTMKGLTFQRMPENKSSPAKLGFVFNPTINGKTSRKGKYFWDSVSFNAYIDELIKIRDLATVFLKCMEKANPTAEVLPDTKSDHEYDLE